MDKKHGQGSYTWADGRKYEGNWANGRQHGEGMYVTQDGVIKRGMWENGKRVKWIDKGFNSNENNLPKDDSDHQGPPQ